MVQRLTNGTPTPPPSKRIGIYCRISYNKTGDSKGVNNQERDCRKLAAQRGWEVAKVYDDDDKSAWQQNVIRKNFDKLVADIGAGIIDGVVFYHMDRVAKTSMAFARLASHYESDVEGRLVSDSVHGGLDLSDPQQRAIGALQALLGGSESSGTSRRMKDHLRNEALDGRVFSNYPAFYRNPDGSINEAKRAIVLKAVSDVLDAGMRPTAIADEWRKAGIKTARGEATNGQVTQSTVHRILTSPGIAGFAVYKNEIVLGDDGKPVERVGGGLIDEATWRQLCEELKKDPGRRSKGTKGLMSKSARCGLCGAGMVRQQKKKGWFAYACRSIDAGGCAKVSISGPRLDEHITDLVLDYLSKPIEPVDDTPFAGAARLEEVGAKIAELMELYRSGELSGSLVFPMVKKLEFEQQSLNAEASRHAKAAKRITTVAEEWPTLSTERKQAVIKQIFEAVVVMPATKLKTNAVDLGRVQVIYRLQVDLAAVEAILRGIPAMSANHYQLAA